MKKRAVRCIDLREMEERERQRGRGWYLLRGLRSNSSGDLAKASGKQQGGLLQNVYTMPLHQTDERERERADMREIGSVEKDEK